MIDAHIHIIPDYTAEQHLALSRPEGVSRTVLIQMSASKFDNSYMLTAVKAHPGVFSAVAIADVESPDLEQTVIQLRREGARGFRITAKPDQPWTQWTGMGKLWTIAGKQKMAVCPLINPDAFPWVASMCEKHRDTTVVIDHLGRIGASGRITDEQVRSLCALAKHPQVHVKVSAFYALGAKRAPYSDLAPMIRQVFETYGPRRLMWGSDAPYQTHTPHTYKASVDFVRSLAFVGKDDMQWLTHRTAERVFFGK